MSYRQLLPFEIVGSAGNIDTVFNRFTNGLRRVSSGVGDSQKQMSVWDNQIKAMGTTLRYFFAGQVIFGAMGAIGALKDFQVELGNIDTVATRLNGMDGLGGQLDNLADRLIKTSDRTITPINTLQQAVTQLYSSLSQNVDYKEIDNVIDRLSKVARVSQVSDPTSLVGSIMGGVNAFGMPKGNNGELANSVGIMGDQFKRVLQRSINISGQEFANYSGNLYKSAAMAGFDSAWAGGLAVQASSFGGTASSIVPNLSQLLTYLKHPKSKSAKAAYAEAGVTEADLLASGPESGPRVLKKLLRHINKLGLNVTPEGRRMTADDLANLPDDATLQDTGVSGRASQFISDLFPRIQSQRTMVVLANESIPALQRQVEDIRNSVGTTDKSFKDFNDAAPLASLANTMADVRLTLMRNLAPGLNPVARGIDFAGKEIDKHPKVTQAVEVGLMAALVGNGIRKLTKKGGAGRAAGAAIVAEEASALISGGAADGSRSNPYWVMISPASWLVGTPGGGMGLSDEIPSKKGGWFSNAWKKTRGTATGALGGLAAKSGGRMALAKAGGLATLLATLPESTVELQRFLEGGGRSIPDGNFPELRKWSTGAVTGFGIHHDPTKAQNKILDMYGSGRLGARRAENLLEELNTLKARGGHSIEVTGETKGTFTFRLVDQHGKTILVQEQRGVPTKLWGTTGAPSSSGKPRAMPRGW